MEITLAWAVRAVKLIATAATASILSEEVIFMRRNDYLSFFLLSKTFRKNTPFR
jgi:hypothetical protein